jgi:anti-anti-sigma regulatory factor
LELKWLLFFGTAFALIEIIEMLRITEVSKDDKVITLRLEGKLVGPWIPDLERICLYHRDEKNKTVVLDFSGVTFIENKGVRMLESIKDDRIKIVNCSQFILSLLSNSIISNN